MAGDTLNKRRGKGWIPKWEAKVEMATVTMAQTLNTNKARILCIAGDKHCGAEMARQPARVRAIKTAMANQVYRVRVELIEIREFSERYRCMAKVFDVKKLQIRWQVHLFGEAASFFFFFPLPPLEQVHISILWKYWWRSMANGTLNPLTDCKNTWHSTAHSALFENTQMSSGTTSWIKSAIGTRTGNQSASLICSKAFYTDAIASFGSFPGHGSPAIVSNAYPMGWFTENASMLSLLPTCKNGWFVCTGSVAIPLYFKGPHLHGAHLLGAATNASI